MTASPYSSPSLQALTRYVEEPRALVGECRRAAAQRRRDVPGLAGRHRGGPRARLARDVHLQRRRHRAAVRGRADRRRRARRRDPPALRLPVGCREHAHRVSSIAMRARGVARHRLPPVPLLAAALLGAAAAKPPQDAGVRRPDRVRGRAEHRERLGVAGGRRRGLARRGRPGRGPAVATIEGAFLRTWNRRAKKWARVDPARADRAAAGRGRGLAVISNSELRDRFVIRRAPLHASGRAAAVCPREPVFRAHRGFLRALPRAVGAASMFGCSLPCESDSPCSTSPPAPSSARCSQSGVRVWHSHTVVHTKAPRRRRRLRVNRQLQPRPPLARLQPRARRQHPRPAACNAAPSRCWRRTWPPATELTRDGFDQRSLLVRLLERLAYALRRWL